jgi:predicted transcriptional regulator
MLSFDLHRSSEKLKRALEDYEAIKKENVKREREAREVVSKLNGDLDSISEGSIEQTTSSVQPSTITVSLQSQEEAAEGEDPKQEPWEQVIDALEQAKKASNYAR